MLVIRHLGCFLEGLQEGPWEFHLNSLWLSYSSVKWDKDIYLLNLFLGLLLFSRYVMSNSLWPHELQHSRLPFPSLFPGVCPNSCPLSQWYHPSISSSVIPFSSYLQSFPASGSFLMSWLFASGGRSIGVSASVLAVNIQGWFALGLTGSISLQSVFSSTTTRKHQFFTDVIDDITWFLNVEPALVFFICIFHMFC